MKTKAGVLSALTVAITMGVGVAHADFAFDGVGDAEYGRSKYKVYYDEFMSACGSYETINHSEMFGPKSEYDQRYPRIGQVHAELEQVAGMKPGSRRHMESTFKEAKKIIDTGHVMKKIHAEQMAAMKENTDRLGAGREYYEHASQKIADSHVDLDRSVKMKGEEAYSSVMSRIRRDGERTPEGENINSSYDRWQECKSFWSYAESNKRQLRR